MFNKFTLKNEIFKNIIPFDNRKSESERLKLMYINKIPIILEFVCDNMAYNKHINKHKYLVHTDITILQFTKLIGEQIKLNKDDTMHIFFNKDSTPLTETIGNIYNCHKNDDGFLYATITFNNIID